MSHQQTFLQAFFRTDFTVEVEEVPDGLALRLRVVLESLFFSGVKSSSSKHLD
jgi:hypothetical protein